MQSSSLLSFLTLLMAVSMQSQNVGNNASRLFFGVVAIDDTVVCVFVVNVALVNMYFTQKHFDDDTDCQSMVD